MSARPIFVATHPRSCSTAFERVFMTKKELKCVHEPFGDAFYWGPERLSERFAHDEAARLKSGFSSSTYKDVLDQTLANAQDRRVFIKDITYYLFPPDNKPATIAPSLQPLVRENESKNPTVIPTSELRKFHFTFLIRHPRRAIPSYYRCTIPPLSESTGFHNFMPNEAGYVELRRLLDYLREMKIVGPSKAMDRNSTSEVSANGNSMTTDGEEVAITVIDADDLLDKPNEVIKAYCQEVGVTFSPDMLSWGEGSANEAKQQFDKWNGFHNDALGSSSLKPRTNKHNPTIESENKEWTEKFGKEAAKVIRETVDANIPHYEYLKTFAIKF